MSCSLLCLLLGTALLALCHLCSVEASELVRLGHTDDNTGNSLAAICALDVLAGGADADCADEASRDEHVSDACNVANASTETGELDFLLTLMEQALGDINECEDGLAQRDVDCVVGTSRAFSGRHFELKIEL